MQGYEQRGSHAIDRSLSAAPKFLIKDVEILELLSSNYYYYYHLYVFKVKLLLFFKTVAGSALIMLQ